MKLKLKRFELVELNRVLNEIINTTKEIFDKRFVFAVYRNLEYFKPEIEAIKNTQKESERFREFQEKIEQIGEEYSEKDENGNPKIEIKNGVEVYVITNRKEEANRKLQELQVQYKDVIEEQKKNLEVFNQLMEEEVEVEICKVSFNYFPEKYSIDKHKVLKFIIKETPEEIENML